MQSTRTDSIDRQAVVPAIGRRLQAPVLVAASAVLVCAAVWLGDPATPGGLLPVCPTKLLLGLDCPGCGTLRMLYALLHGNVAAAARYNALTLTALLSAVPVYAVWTYGRMRDRRTLRWHGSGWAVPTVIVLTSVWFVVRNLPFSPFTALRV